VKHQVQIKDGKINVTYGLQLLDSNVIGISKLLYFILGSGKDTEDVTDEELDPVNVTDEEPMTAIYSIVVKSNSFERVHPNNTAAMGLMLQNIK
jgi:hypothetical protein